MCLFVWLTVKIIYHSVSQKYSLHHYHHDCMYIIDFRILSCTYPHAPQVKETKNEKFKRLSGKSSIKMKVETQATICSYFGCFLGRWLKTTWWLVYKYTCARESGAGLVTTSRLLFIMREVIILKRELRKREGEAFCTVPMWKALLHNLHQFLSANGTICS